MKDNRKSWKTVNPYFGLSHAQKDLFILSMKIRLIKIKDLAKRSIIFK